MNTRTLKAEAAHPQPTSPYTLDSRRIEAIREAAEAAHEQASLLPVGLRGALGRALRRIVGAVLDWPRRQLALAELNALTDRELADIGLNRGDFARILAQPTPPRPAAAAASKPLDRPVHPLPA